MASKSKRTPQFTNNPPPSSGSDSSDEEEVEEQPTSQPPPKPIKSKPQPEPESEKEESDDDEDDDESGDEDEKQEKPSPVTQKQDLAQKGKKNPKEDSSDDDEDGDEEDESGSDSSDEDEEEQKGSGKGKRGGGIEPVVKPVPIRSKSMNSKPVVKPGQAGNLSKKRPPASPIGAAEKVGKKAKKEEEVGKKVPRIWSEEDEIVLLEGVVEFQRKNGVSVNSDPGKFHDTVKDKFSMSVDKMQMKEKLRRLKDKFNRMKGSEGKSPDASKPHDSRCFELFNKIWGDGDVVSNNVDGSENAKKKATSGTPIKSGKKGSANGSNVVVGMKVAGVGNGGSEVEAPMDVDVVKDVPAREDRPEMSELYPHLMRALKSRENSVGGGAVLSTIGLLGESELKGLDERWKKMVKTELQFYIKEMDRRKEEADLLKDQANMVFNAMKF